MAKRCRGRRRIDALRKLSNRDIRIRVDVLIGTGREGNDKAKENMNLIVMEAFVSSHENAFIEDGRKTHDSLIF